MIRNLFCSLPALLALGATAATAAPAPQQVLARVSVADLDLSREAGARVALQRLHAAAVVACGGDSDLRQLERRALFRACVRGATDRAVASAHSRTLAALYEAPVPVTQVAQAR